MGPENVRSDHEPQQQEEEEEGRGAIMSWFIEGIRGGRANRLMDV